MENQEFIVENLPGEVWAEYDVTECHRKPTTCPPGDPTRVHYKTITWYVSNHGRIKKSSYTFPLEVTGLKTCKYAGQTREELLPLYTKGGSRKKHGSKFHQYKYACVPKGQYVHRLVAEAFIPNPEMKKTVNHIDGNKLNNHVSNLEWATYKEQMKHVMDNGLANPFGFGSGN